MVFPEQTGVLLDGAGVAGVVFTTTVVVTVYEQAVEGTVITQV